MQKQIRKTLIVLALISSAVAAGAYVLTDNIDSQTSDHHMAEMATEHADHWHQMRGYTSDAVTHIVAQSGVWSDPATWQDGVLPTSVTSIFGLTYGIPKFIPLSMKSAPIMANITGINFRTFARH